jgi:hypothetical protein
LRDIDNNEINKNIINDMYKTPPRYDEHVHHHAANDDDRRR